MITVFHAESMPRFKYEEGNSYLTNLRSTDFGKFADTMSYTLVAIVDTDDLNKAYELTNHIDQDWYYNKDVAAVRRTRSTSVGDMMIFDNKIYIVERIGFKEIEIKETK